MGRAAILVSLALHGAVCAAAWQWAAVRPMPAGGGEGPSVSLFPLIQDGEPAVEPQLPSIPAPPEPAPPPAIVTANVDAPSVLAQPQVATPAVRWQAERAQRGGRDRGASGGGAQMAFTPPSYRRAPAPAYPAAARAGKLAGTVLLRVSVSADGHAQSVAVRRSSGHAVLDAAAVRAVRAWEFEPARTGGLAVAALVEVPVRFVLPGRAA